MKLLAKSLILATALAIFVTAGAAAPLVADIAALGPLPKEALAYPSDPVGRHRDGVVRALPKAAVLAAWTAEEAGFVSRSRVRSEGAQGLRVRIDLGSLAGPVEIRAQGEDGVEVMTVDPARGPTAWTPWTDGPEQVIEVRSRVLPAADALTVGAIVHMTEKSTAKVAAACTISTSCTTGDAALDAAIATRKKSVMRISFIDSGGAFTCTATLIDTPQRPAPFVLTANHCIGSDAAANSITSRWFYEQTPCGSTSLDPANVQVAGGMQLVFANYNADASLLRMNASPPSGAVYATVNAARLTTNASVASVSHPRGDASRTATGNVIGESNAFDLPYSLYNVRLNRGLIENGSSGGGLFTLVNGTLQLRGIASAASTEMSCANTEGPTLWSRADVFWPQMAQYVGVTSSNVDDAPNRYHDWDSVPRTNADPDIALNERAAREMSLGPKRIEYAGDVDIFRFYVSAPTVVTAYTTGSTDTVGSILNARGEGLVANDDAQVGQVNAGMTATLPAGTYYFHVAAFDPAATGTYTPVLRADNVGPENLTSLWWNPAESGWGLNVNHQGDTLFATLFTYDTDGAPMWLVMSNGVRQADGSFRGDLGRTTGPIFNAPWAPGTSNPVGTMTIQVSATGNMLLNYTIDGVAVQKSLVRQVFVALPVCGWSLFDRSYTTNVQDLWWNPAEPGWGLNIAHQSNTLFVTLFTYGADGKARWYVVSSAARSATNPNVFSGALHRTQGPAFNSVPWGTVSSAPVGNMTLTFTHGNAATLAYSVDGVSVTKQIQRQVFGTPKVACEP